MPEEINLRPGTLDNSYKVFALFEHSVSDLSQRQGLSEMIHELNPDHLAQMWLERRPLYEHLAHTADQFWIAEQGGQPVGYARSILRDTVRQLTELFVLPDIQSGGLGSRLLEAAFPSEGAEHRSIIATTDTRALALYLKNGLTPYFPILYFERPPEKVIVTTDLAFEPLESTQLHLEALAAIDAEVLGFRRDVDHQWLMGDRRGFLIRRKEQPVGYGYHGLRSGPFALLDPQDFPIVLAFFERELADLGQDHFGLEVPLVNKIAVNYLLGRGFEMDGFIALRMADEPFGSLDRYIVTAPPFFL